MQLRKFKIHNSARRQIERWRDGLVATVRRLPDRFIAEELLAERYGVDLLADAEVDAAAGESGRGSSRRASTRRCENCGPSRSCR